jgi:2',3'-cyclic-nucleotide 2'-phosphodiesterase
MIRILMLGDVVGKPGRNAVTTLLGGLREEFAPDLIIANGENAAGGLGITRETALPLFEAGVQVITLGNHTFTKREGTEFLEDDPRVIRPANYPSGVPGRGYCLVELEDGVKVCVINLMGRVFMTPIDDPLRVADFILANVKGQTSCIFVDMHAEATSEKGAVGRYLDGRVSAVIGTHTHVPTDDACIFPGGTAFVTDVGMVGPKHSILGMKTSAVIARFQTQITSRFEVASGNAVLMAVVVDIEETSGKAVSIRRLVRETGGEQESEN